MGDFMYASIDRTNKTLTGILCMFDRLERDAEINLLLECTEADFEYIWSLHRAIRVLYGSNPKVVIT